MSFSRSNKLKLRSFRRLKSYIATFSRPHLCVIPPTLVGELFKRTFSIIIICNIVHFFTTPYLMAKNAFSKMNPAWETTGELLGDTWIKTMIKVIIPSSITTIVEMLSYYFINSMVTISAIIFLVTARTSVVTSKIKQLQHFENFNEIFVLSILIFITNILMKICCDAINKKLSIH